MRKFFLLGLFLGSVCCASSFAQSDYPTLSQVNQRIQKLSVHPSVELKTLTKTVGGKEIFALKIGTGATDQKPALAVVGGVEGFHVLSVELALQFAEKLVEEHSKALESTTFYVFPNMSPDAYAQYHAALKYERRGNAATVDHDRDGMPADNGYSDLNGDGLITWMRVADPMGEWTTSKEDPRVMVKADRSKGEAGKYLVFKEGVDADRDGKFAEDLSEGIAFNKSLTYKFPVFEPLAGDIAVSQLESRALLDYLFEQWNIFAFVTFSPANNLSNPWRYSASEARKRVVTSILEKDQVAQAMVAELYSKSNPAKAFQQTNQGTDGDFFQWAYFHFARFSFSTPGYWTPEYKGKTNAEANFLAWSDSLKQDVFVPWVSIKHPDFPNQQVEVGGIKPFVMVNPPFEKVGEIAKQHTDFILKLAAMQPKLEFHHLKAEKLGNGLTRISVDLFNNSPLPTHSEMGTRSRWLKKLRIDLKVPVEQLIAGEAVQLLPALGAFEKASLSWIVKAKGPLELKAGAPHAGFVTQSITF
jgi:Zinc carboxypeptidase